MKTIQDYIDEEKKVRENIQESEQRYWGAQLEAKDCFKRGDYIGMVNAVEKWRKS